jgi:adenosine deaminase
MSLAPVHSTAQAAFTAFLQQAPKAEVHVHLEGAVSIEFLSRRAALHALPWAGRAGPELAARRRFSSLDGFLQLFRWVLEEHFRTPEDYAAALDDVGRSFSEANIRYAELSVSAGALLFFNRPLGEIAGAITERAEALERSGGPELRFIADGVRQHGPEPLGRVLEIVRALPRRRWPALGLAGAEASLPPKEFVEVFAAARGAGLLADVHAGEAAGPASVWEALEHLSPDRLVHAVTASRDLQLLQELRARRVPLALNPTSNVRTGAVSSLEGYPLRRLLRAGLVLSINTDDPTLFGTTLAGELEALSRSFRLDQVTVEQLLLGGLECAFLPEPRRLRLLERWSFEFERLRRELGLEERMLGAPTRAFL